MVAGVLLGAHGYISSIGSLTELPWSAACILGALCGMMFLVLDRWRKGSINFLMYRPLVLPIFFLALVLAIGTIQQYLRGDLTAYHLGAMNGVIAQMDSLTYRDERNATWIVMTRWLPYTLTVILGCILGGFERFMNWFSLSAVIQVAAIAILPGQHVIFAEYFRNLLAFNGLVGFEWEAINRAYLGYECSVAASWFLLSALSRERIIKSWHLYFFSVLALSLVLLSFSKGPWIAALISVAAIFAKKLKIGLCQIRNSLGIILAILIFMAGTAILFQKYDTESDFIQRIENSFRFDQSVSIRMELLTKAAYPSINDLVAWFFGRGFGWSRWQASQDNGLPEFIGSGTHVFFLDVFLDVGAVGLLLLFISILRIYFIAYKGFLNTGARKNLIFDFIPIFCIVLFVKALLASDSYSEPLFALLIGLLVSAAARYLKHHKEQDRSNNKCDLKSTRG
jgi:hypothetical protein